MLTMRRFRFSLIPVLLFALAGCQGLGNIKGGNIHTDQFIGKEPPMTILLAEYHGLTAKADAERACSELLAHGLSDAFVIGETDEAYLCYGTYSDRLDKSYHENRLKVAQISDPAGKPAFGPGIGVLLPEAAPPSPYDLARARGTYTVMVATFDLYGHKHAAADYAAQLRKEGWPAYVFQTDVMSHVTIGVFNDDIFAADEKGAPLSSEDKAALAQLNVHQKAARAFFEEWKDFNMANNKGKKIAPVIISPEVKRILAVFPYLNWDGHLFTPEEAAKMKGTATRRFEGPNGTAPIETRQPANFARLVQSSLVIIPTAEHGPASAAPTAPPKPQTPPAPRGPIPSPTR
jgi:hypothetical protein